MSEQDKFGEIDLVELLGVDLTAIPAMRFGENLPRFLGDFECGEPTIEEIKEENKIVGALVRFPWTVIGVKDPGKSKEDGVEDPMTLIGRKHNETFFLKGPTNLSYLRGFITDVGGDGNAKLLDAIKSVQGKRIRALITHRKDKNDPDKVYAGLGKYKPLAD